LSKSQPKSTSKRAAPLAALLLPATLASQAPSRDLRLALGGNVGTLPDAFEARCGDAGGTLGTAAASARSPASRAGS